MSTVDPNKITMIRYKGSVMTGRIRSVGIDGAYVYNYNHPQDALDTAIDGDIILIYPGVYSPKNGLVLSITKNIRVFIRGMGDFPSDVVLTTPSDIYHTVRVDCTDATNMFVVIENMRIIANRSWSGGVVHRQCSASTVTVLNKLHIYAPSSGYPIYFGDTSGTYVNYKGDSYMTNCSIERGYAHFFKLGAGSTTSIISAQKMLYLGGAYNTYQSTRDPSPNDYTLTNTTGYGALYGTLFFEIITEPIFKADLTRKRNIWFKDPYLYKATASGVNIYNASSQALIKRTSFSSGINSVWADDDYFYMATSISGIYRCQVSSISGTSTFERYKSYPDITANDVNYLHGCGDYLCTATVSGVDRYTLSTNDRISVIKSNVSKCFQTSNGDHYYIVNSFNDILGLDDNIFGWSYGRTITPSSTIPSDNYQFYFEIPVTQPDNIYRQAQQGGADIRIIDDTGVATSYYIATWDYIASPKIWTTLSSGTKMFYVLYGNPIVESRYDYDSIWVGNPTISGYTISRGQSINDLFRAVELHAVYNDGSEYVYESKQNNLLNVPYITDIYITEDTSRYEYGNTIFLSTSWGAMAIEEKRGDEANATKRRYLIST